MDVKDYCRSIELELSKWKAKMYDMVRNVDKLRGVDKERISSEVEDLHKYVSEVEKIVIQLQTECPSDFSAQRKKIEEAHREMSRKYRDAMAAILQF